MDSEPAVVNIGKDSDGKEHYPVIEGDGKDLDVYLSGSGEAGKSKNNDEHPSHGKPKGGKKRKGIPAKRRGGQKKQRTGGGDKGTSGAIPQRPAAPDSSLIPVTILFSDASDDSSPINKEGK